MRLLTILVFVLLSIAALLFPFVMDKTGSTRPDSSVVAELPAIPEVAIQTQLPNFASMTNVKKKKQQFFGFLLPLVEAENIRILHNRARLKALHQRFKDNALTASDKKKLSEWIAYYRLDDDVAVDEHLFRSLKERIDLIPEMMVLVQAANESGWGTSRFARKGLNLFGQWCYSKGCGLVPSSRNDGAVHEVARFNSVNASINSYMRNINTHYAYSDLRRIRATKRKNGAAIKAKDLIQGLSSYSERGQEYIDELESMIRVNRPVVEQVKATKNAP